MPEAYKPTTSIPGTFKGLLVPGNIDIARRPQVRNKDGSISTVRSMSINMDGREILIPTVIGDRVVSDKEAIDHFRKTGEHLGMFDDSRNANEYAAQLHMEQSRRYPPPPKPKNMDEWRKGRRDR